MATAYTIIDPHTDILTQIKGNEYSLIEEAARTCYKSEGSNPDNDPEISKRFVKGLIKRGHEAMLEHSILSVRFVTDRGVSHEIIRHRHFSFAQESTRYVDYNDGGKAGGLVFIRPFWYNDASFNDQKVFDEYLTSAVSTYNYFRDGGHTPQECRDVLPNCTKTEIVVTGNYREWRHFFKLRAANTTGPAHPNMNRVACPLLVMLHELVPVVFDDIYEVMTNDKQAQKYMTVPNCFFNWRDNVGK